MSEPGPRCPFCPPPPEAVLAETTTAVALRDGFPVTEGHTLIVPRRHAASFFDLTAEERTEILELVDRIREQLAEDPTIEGYNIGLNDGHAAGQTIPHVHLHVIPRRAGDVPDPRGGIRWVIPGKARYWSDEA